MRKQIVSWLGVGVLSLMTAGASAQGVYSLGDAAYLETGCGGPSPCDCAVFVVGPLGGTFELTRVGTSGSFDVFAISNFDGVLGAMGPLPVVTPITGSGTYRVDAAAGVHGIELNLIVGQTPQTFVSVGDVPGGELFPDGVLISAYRELQPGGCEYDGIHLIAGLTQRAFQRGDCNNDANRNVADPVFLLGLLFGPTDPLAACDDACDANDDGTLNIADAVFLLTVLFGGGVLPAPTTCGVDPTNDVLDCSAYSGC